MNDFEIVPCIELDPEETGVSRPAVSSKPIDGLTLFAVRDVMHILNQVAEFLHRVHEGPEFFGGYAFMDRGVYRYGGFNWFSLHREWEWAFQKIQQTDVVDVSEDACKDFRLTRIGDRLEISYSKGPKLEVSWRHFCRESEKAVAEMQSFKAGLQESARRVLSTSLAENMIKYIL